MRILSVKELTAQISSILSSHFLSLEVRGEVSNVVFHSSGHVYFTLKDRESSIDCILFKRKVGFLSFEMKAGDLIVVGGSLIVYPPQGRYKINVDSVSLDGIGSLSLEFEFLKKKLYLDGFFDKNKAIPPFPNKIVFLTSRGGAVLHDMLEIASNRYPLVNILFIDTLTQGKNSKYSIVKNLKVADSLVADCIIIARGGGSVEDLWPFNELIVAEAIYSCVTPVVSAIGHETDYLLSDYVADLRAPTPSSAIELVLPDKNELLSDLQLLGDMLNDRMNFLVSKKIDCLEDLESKLLYHGFHPRLLALQSSLDSYAVAINSFMLSILSGKESMINIDFEFIFFDFLKSKKGSVDSYAFLLDILSPDHFLLRRLVQLFRDGKVVSLQDLCVGDLISLNDSNLSVDVRVVRV